MLKFRAYWHVFGFELPKIKVRVRAQGFEGTGFVGIKSFDV